MTENKKIIWAIDPFAQDSLLNKKLGAVLNKWTKDLNAEIEPVYVISPDQMSTPLALFPIAIKDIEAKAKEKLQKILSPLKLKNAKPPVILTSSTYSLKTTTQTLIDHAKNSGADLIAIGTHTKKGVARFFLGSFAETLILRADVPVLILNPKYVRVKPIKNLFFATDFSDASKSILDRIVALAKEHKFKVTLYNNVEFLTQHTQTFLTKSPMYKDFLKNEEARRKEELNQIASEAKSQGVDVKVLLDSNPKSQSVSDSLLKAAKKSKADVIAVASQTSALGGMFFGSVARDIVRRSECPVWVMHPPIAAMALRPRTSKTRDEAHA